MNPITPSCLNPLPVKKRQKGTAYSSSPKQDAGSQQAESKNKQPLSYALGAPSTSRQSLSESPAQYDFYTPVQYRGAASSSFLSQDAGSQQTESRNKQPLFSRITANALKKRGQISAHTDLVKSWKKWENSPYIFRQSGKNLGKNENRAGAVKILNKCLVNNESGLDLCGLRLTSLPENLPPHITTLNIRNNLLTRLPENLPSRLTSLSLWSNDLTRLPENLPEGLSSVDASLNQLDRLPEILPGKLTHLYLSGNQLTRLPDYQITRNPAGEIITYRCQQEPAHQITGNPATVFVVYIRRTKPSV